MVCRTTEDTLPWTRPSLSTLPNCTIFEHHYGTPYNEPRSPLRFVGPVYAVHWSDGVNCNRGCPSTLRYYLITCITYIHKLCVPRKTLRTSLIPASEKRDIHLVSAPELPKNFEKGVRLHNNLRQSRISRRHFLSIFWGFFYFYFYPSFPRGTLTGLHQTLALLGLGILNNASQVGNIAILFTTNWETTCLPTRSPPPHLAFGVQQKSRGRLGWSAKGTVPDFRRPVRDHSTAGRLSKCDLI